MKICTPISIWSHCLKALENNAGNVYLVLDLLCAQCTCQWRNLLHLSFTFFFAFQRFTKNQWLQSVSYWSMGGVAVWALASHHCDPGSIPGVGRCHMWVEFSCCWFSPLLRGFFSGFSGFPPSVKINILKFQLDLVEEAPLCGTTVNSYLFIYLIYITVSYKTLK
jgi:hypothetical protein